MQIEELELKHATYSKLINGGIKTVEQLVHILVSKDTHAEEEALGLTPRELVEVQAAVGHAQQKEVADRIGTVLNEAIYDWINGRNGEATAQEFTAHVVKSYERIFGVGSKIVTSEPEDGADQGLCACRRDRTECIKSMPCLGEQ